MYVTSAFQNRNFEASNISLYVKWTLSLSHTHTHIHTHAHTHAHTHTFHFTLNSSKK